MKQKPNRYRKFFLIPVIFTVALIACQRDNEIISEPEVASMAAPDKGNSPAAQIASSEKLEIPEAVDLPANLPNGNSRVATFFAEGVQKYKAQVVAGSNPVTYKWVFVSPQADLFDVTNAKVGIHSAGPVWTLSAADSIFAQHFSPPQTAPSQDPESVDWLLLMPKAGTTPTGIFADVDYIQRIATKGGKAPTTAPTSANETVEVKYKAVYRFSKKNL